MEMKELGVWQKSVYVFLYSSNLIGWIISLLYADIYYLIFVQTDQDSTFSFKQDMFQLMKTGQI